MKYFYNTFASVLKKALSRIFSRKQIAKIMIQIVEKRDGRVVGYNEDKIKASIRKYDRHRTW